MTVKPRVARSLRDVRERLRDVAAASHAAAVGEVERHAAAVAEEHERLGASIAGASGLLAGARSVAELDRVRVEIDACRGDVAAAAARHGDAQAARDATERALREKTRQLRSAERILELVEERRFGMEARGEQRAADDMAAGRRR
jgi:hypothetical protein